MRHEIREKCQNRGNDLPEQKSAFFQRVLLSPIVEGRLKITRNGGEIKG